MTNLFSTFRPLLAFTLLAGITACAPPGLAPEIESETTLPEAAAVPSESRVHVMPVRDPIDFTTTRPREIAPSGAHLTYYGGRVISNVKVVTVFWGNNVSYASQLNQFYSGFTNSSMFDWLSEYDTVLNGGTNQHIGRGTFDSTYNDTTAPGGTVTDAQIKTELTSLINNGKVAADTTANPNAIYMIHFAPGIKVTQGGSSSCVPGGFCAYHGTFTLNGHDVYYGVVPDMGPGSGCDTGCGGSTQFNNETSVSSHELVEAVTDAEVGLATVFAAPLAWYDSLNGEIGDICNAQQGSIVGGNGITYVVQQEFSNAAHDCIVSKTCTPSCNGKQCGSDGCGGSCGSCAGSNTCDLTGQCVAEPFNTDISITASANGKLVTAENAGASALIANRTAVGPWERFQFVDLGNGNVGLRANVNGRYVCADNNGTSALIANRTSIGAWETYTFMDLGNGYFALQAHANNKIVTADNGGSLPLIANRTAVGSWETFRWTKL